MKVVAINGSPRRDGNCEQLLKIFGNVMAENGIEFEILETGPRVKPCMACYHCLNKGTGHCVQNDDCVNAIIDKCVEADGILFTSPVYHGGISGNMKCVLDRMMLAAGCGENKFAHKVAGALCTLRRSGGLATYEQLLGAIGAFEMLLVTADYWGAVHGAEKGEALQDIEGVEVTEKLARNMAWTVKMVAETKVEKPHTEHRTMFNYIR